MRHFSPSTYVILIAGGVGRLARLLGLDPSTISKWNNRVTKSGEKGHVPRSCHIRILEIAREKQWDITAEDLIYGRKLSFTPEHHKFLKISEDDK